MKIIAAALRELYYERHRSDKGVATFGECRLTLKQYEANLAAAGGL